LYIPYKVYPQIKIDNNSNIVSKELTEIIRGFIPKTAVKILLPDKEDFSMFIVFKQTMSEDLFNDIYNCFSVYLKNDTDISMYYKVGDEIVLRKQKTYKKIQENKTEEKVAFVADE
jgi:hypothetical protein